MDRPLCHYFKTYEIGAHIYNDTSILFDDKSPSLLISVSRIRNRYNQVPHQTQDINGKVTNSQLDTTNVKRLKEYNGVKISLGLSLQFIKDERYDKNISKRRDMESKVLFLMAIM